MNMFLTFAFYCFQTLEVSEETLSSSAFLRSHQQSFPPSLISTCSRDEGIWRFRMFSLATRRPFAPNNPPLGLTSIFSIRAKYAAAILEKVPHTISFCLYLLALRGLNTSIRVRTLVHSSSKPSFWSVALLCF